MRAIEMRLIEELEEFEEILQDIIMRMERISGTYGTIHKQLNGIEENAVVIRNLASEMT